MNPIEQELKEIYDVLIMNGDNNRSRDFFYEGKAQATALWATLFCLSGAIISTLAANRSLAMLFTSATLLFDLTYISLAFIRMAIPLFNINRQFLLDLKEEHSEEQTLIRRLTPYSLQAQRKVASRLRVKATILRSRVALLVGALDKLGIVPALAVFGFTYAKYRKEGNLVGFEDYLAIALITVHLGALLANHAIARAEKLARVIEDAVMQFENAENSTSTTGTVPDGYRAIALAPAISSPPARPLRF